MQRQRQLMERQTKELMSFPGLMEHKKPEVLVSETKKTKKEAAAKQTPAEEVAEKPAPKNAGKKRKVI